MVSEEIVNSKTAWQVFRVYQNLGPAEALRVHLEFEGVPTRVDPRRLENGVETEYCVSVSAALAHRARWIVAQLPPTEEELTFLATGKLPGQP
jgi:hypothetical protein